MIIFIFINFQYHKLSRSEEHTSELQSQSNLVCRLLLEKIKNYLHKPGITTACQPIRSNYPPRPNCEHPAQHSDARAALTLRSLSRTSHSSHILPRFIL